MDIVATELQLLGGREGMGSPGGNDGYSEEGAAPVARRPAPAARPAAAPAARTAPAARPPSGFDDMDDDIPF